MITGFRLCKPKRQADAFTGEGARLFGGRFNSKGTPVVYVAGSQSLAALELLVHLDAHEVMAMYSLIRVEFDDELVSAIELDELPKDWRKSPVPPSVQLLGDDWVRKGKSAVLRVPSVIIPSEYNYVLNVAHPQFGKIKIREAESFGFDPRLLKQPKSLD